LIPRRSLRLLVDPPYPGESTSSFLSRTAQAYRISVFDLVKQLVPDRRTQRDLVDLDRWPCRPLLDALSAAVPAWPSGALTYEAGQRWFLLPRCRRAYCPLCFAEDLAADRTPYFRFEWTPVVTLCCWRHHTPLFDWQDVGRVGVRQLPNDWIDGTGKAEVAPSFYMLHLELLTKLRSNPDRKIQHDGLCLGEMFALLTCVQSLFALPSSEPPPKPPSEAKQIDAAWMEAITLCRIAFGLAEEGRSLLCDDPGQIAECASDWLASGDLGGRPAKNFKVYIRRRCASIEWRRYYWLFVAQALASRPGVSELLKEAKIWRSWHPYAGVVGKIYPAGRWDLGRFDWLYQVKSLEEG